jgi:16S rRNA (adenine1518-N6/adenine1519-N6)-dimethyltransferase
VTRERVLPGGLQRTARQAATIAQSAAPAPASALAFAGVRPHKSKGQNFLTQPRVADRIVAAAEIYAGEEVIEIGPGLGILSERIAALPVSRLVLVELDSRLAEALAGRYAGDGRVTIMNRDFLTIDPHELPSGAPQRIVANLPFNAASAIFERLCSMHARILKMVLMFQREVGERIRARPGTPAYGALSAYTLLYWTIVNHFRVAAGSFHPRPKVDAEVLVFAPRTPLPFNSSGEERALLATIRAAFSAPRKMLRNALGMALELDTATIETALAHAAIDPGARAATLTQDDLIRLARVMAPIAAWNRDDA